MENFEDIYESYSKQIFRICLGYTNDSDAAKDLVQETFISVWKSLPSFNNKSNIGTWIYRIATNHCLRAIEISQKMPQGPLPSQVIDKVQESKEEKLNVLYRCISELNETERIIISLELEDLPQRQIAEIVGLSSSNVRVKLHRIKEKLASKFKAYESV